ncbi:sugar transferase [Planococcus liqunii]|uniref:Sugar transferase n=1 Tax=Planococcus liqunii TaxID=3058394 RepID=A0ABT8MNP4_9BACL|nr:MULTISPECIES: sugar transferase [unclassified Planococcus (in: firmicutes)]MDN7226406.1 sugar transferase [Planococcus sp. N064]WKA50179.1 sugar transferase [Planococcus sp. N056]
MKFLLKRLMDIVISSVGIIVLLPFFIIIPIAIKLDTKGSVIFKQGRLSKKGALFTMYKFRTMVENAESMGTGLFNYHNDFRVTKVGNFLRRTSLDELPQLFNVLKGDMSVVGPRPPVSYELGNYEDLNGHYKNRFNVLPGITGLAQVSGRNELEWDEKINFDNRYIDLFKKYGILIDIKIIILTIQNIFVMKNIYEIKDEESASVPEEEIASKAQEAVEIKARSLERNKHKTV